MNSRRPPTGYLGQMPLDSMVQTPSAAGTVRKFIPVYLSTRSDAIPIYLAPQNFPAAQPVYFSNSLEAVAVRYAQGPEARPVVFVPNRH